MSVRFSRSPNARRVRLLCRQLIELRRGKMLGDEVLRQLPLGELTDKTYARLSRWVNPARTERHAQPIALEISLELYGRRIGRIPD